METKNCQNCKTDFTIEPEDFDFYSKMKVPPPTFCPSCRLQRRLAWFNLTNLFHRDCDLCGERFISMYPKEAPYVVYCPECWWSDKWDWRDYGQDYDFTRPFFEQLNELIRKTPIMGLAVNTSTIVGFPYNNYATHIKNCYLTFNTDQNQDCAHGTSIIRSRESFDSSMVMDCDSVYDCACIYKSNNVVGGRGNNRFCIDSYFLYDCENCQDCFMSINLKNKKYCYKNEQYDKDQYFEKIKQYDLSSYIGYRQASKEAKEFWKNFSPQPVWDTLSVNCSGSYVFHSKNCHECYDVGDSENCKFCMMLWQSQQNDCYDVTTYGDVISNIYEGMNIFEKSSDIKFSVAVGINALNIEYSISAIGGKNQIGCVAARKGEYVIFNKEYNKDQYDALRKKIIAHIDEMPYTDKAGNMYKYGEFFPLEMSPFPYNKTFANLFFPRSNEEIKSFGGSVLEEEEKTYSITKKASEIPDNIKDVDRDILDEVFECENCQKGYKIIEMEFEFLKKNNLPISHHCPFCRINEKLMIWVYNMTLKDRICDKCGKDFRTHYSKDHAPVIYCKECYQKEYN